MCWDAPQGCGRGTNAPFGVIPFVTSRVRSMPAPCSTMPRHWLSEAEQQADIFGSAFR
jgi:hypothetical protein